MTDTPLDRPEQEPTGELPSSLRLEDREALQELHAAGWGEGDHDDAGLPDGFWQPEEQPWPS